jgi:hypothetical protein
MKKYFLFAFIFFLVGCWTLAAADTKPNATSLRDSQNAIKDARERAQQPSAVKNGDNVHYNVMMDMFPRARFKRPLRRQIPT